VRKLNTRLIVGRSGRIQVGAHVGEDLRVCQPSTSPCRPMWLVGQDSRSSFWRQIGVILHQPLNLSIFRKNAKNSQNMNGIPVCLRPKTENAPTWRSPRPLFWVPFWPVFWHFLLRFYFQSNISIHPYFILYYSNIIITNNIHAR